MDERLQIARSWDANARLWADAVRQGRIPSRRAGTDRAIVEAVEALPAGRLLDIGCGEGWLVRAAAAMGWTGTGTDASAALVAIAREAGGGEFVQASYSQLAADRELVPGPFDAVVANFSLLEERIAELLRAMAPRLAPGGSVLIQTVHPWTALGDAPYRDGWRTEQFTAFGEGWTEMPWFYRTLESWMACLDGAGLRVQRLREPRDEQTARPLSMLFVCHPRER